MTLTFEIKGPQAAQLGASARKTFAAVGGSIGRTPDNDWVIPDPYISSHHARVHCRDGRYFLEDTSTNGVFVNNPNNRLVKGELFALESGERVYIDAYEIHVTVVATAAQSASGPSVLADLFGGSASSSPIPSSTPAAPRATPFIPEDPFGASIPAIPASPSRGSSSNDPFARPLSSPMANPIPSPLMNDSSLAASADPLELLGLSSKPASAPGPTAADLARHSPLNDYYSAPTAPIPAATNATPVATPPTPSSSLIPDDYDFLGDALAPTPPPIQQPPQQPTQQIIPTPPAPKPIVRPTPGVGKAQAPTPSVPPIPPVAAAPVIPPPTSVPPASPKAPVAPPPAAVQALRSAPPKPAIPAAPAPVASAVAPTPVTASDTATMTAISNAGSLDLQALLAGAGIPASAITPDLAQNLGEILRVVVDGVMDVLRARERIKDEFRMRMTTFKPADNNPLKFSANAEDALYNLLVKRNSAFLGPVAAFEDGFEDIRNHQMAMLAGMRVAYDTLLKSFDPEQLQERFDKQSGRSSLLAVAAKMRYWDQYRERFHDMVKDPESSFRELFGAEFARAYEEQLERLRAVNRNVKKTPKA